MLWMKQYEGLMEKLKENLDETRYLHTLGVAHLAVAYAMNLGEDPDRAFLAGLLHDCAKNVPKEERVPKCLANGIPVSAVEARNTELLHSKLGTVVARDEYGIKDPEILSAIFYHTTGRPDMTPLEKIIFTADYLEPNRFKQQNLPELRKLAFADIDACVYRICEDTIRYLSRHPDWEIDETTRKTYEFYKTRIEEKEHGI